MNPPSVFLVGLAAVAGLSAVTPLELLSSVFVDMAGVALIAVGLWLNIRGSGQFERAGTPIRPGSRGGALVTDGVFRFSRNPMYLGMAAVLLGAALALGSAAACLVAPGFVWLIDRRFVAMEEQILQEQFGEQYRRYQERVARWL